MKVLLAALIAAQPVGALAQTGNEMLPSCKYFVDYPQGQATFTMGLCAGAVTAVAYVANMLPEHRRACLPNGVTNEQMVRVLVRHMEANPSRVHEDYRQLAIDALRSAWPCQ